MKTIESLEMMESIVSKNKNLSWDGWTVVDKRKNPTAFMSNSGAFIDKQWYTLQRYEPTRDGWSIPDKFVR